MNAPTLWDHVPPKENAELRRRLVNVAGHLLSTRGSRGATVGEVVQIMEEEAGIRVGGVPMEDPGKQQRQTSWLHEIMRQAGGCPTQDSRKSPVPRHHSRRQVVWVAREVERCA